MSSDGSYSILAVDDNELNLGLFKLFLSQLGHEVVAVNNPQDAINLATQQTFDLIFTDIQMPGMSGIEASAHFRANGFVGPIIAITAHLSETEQREVLSSAISDVLYKPVTKPELVRVINNWLNSQDQRAPGVASEPAVYRVDTGAKGTVYDLELALSRANGSTDVANEMFELLLEHLNEVQATLSGTPSEEELRALLHKLLGGVKFTGASSLENTIESIQYDIHQTDKPLMPLTEALAKEIQLLIDWIKDHPTPFTD